ncbi:MAG: peptidoglycan endopeptidase [Patescibacteria group bacterium]
MKKILLLCISLTFLIGCNTFSNEKKLFATAQLPTPVLYTPDFTNVFGGQDGSNLKLDEYGEIDELEFIALPGTVFNIIDTIHADQKITIYQVTTPEYPYETEKGYYIDSRFVKTSTEKPPQREINLPTTDQIISNLKAAEGQEYTWGGNYFPGIPELLTWYPPQHELDNTLANQWTLQGVDCSGLLYQATNGYTPRNTSLLLNFGNPVEIENKNQADIIANLQPLDLIVWDGHVIIVLNNQEIIESRLDYDKTTEGMQGGVRRRPIVEVFTELMNEKIPVNDYQDPNKINSKRFVIRRWIK